MRFRQWVLAGLAVTLPTQALADTATPSCLTSAEVQNLVAFALPSAVTIADGMCAKVLPAPASFTQTAQALQKQYQPASDAAWPAARATLLKVLASSTKDDGSRMVFAGLLTSNDPGPLRNMAVAMLSSQPASAKACTIVGRVLPLLQPMPPENMADLLEVVIEMMVNDHKPGAKPPRLQMCPVAPAQP